MARLGSFARSKPGSQILDGRRGLKIELAVEGNLRREMDAELDAIAKGLTGAVKEAGALVQQRLRDQVTGSGLGPRLAKTVRLQVYPRGQLSLEPAAFIYTKAPKILNAFAGGVTIKSKDGFFLAIPTDNAPKKGVGGKRINPTNWPEHRFGRLRFVYRARGPSLLVADELRASYARKTGQFRGFRQASVRAREKGQTATAVMFVLVPQVRLSRRLNPKAAGEAGQRRLASLIARNLGTNRTRLS